MATSTSAYFPWTWTIESTDPTLHTCPTVSSLLGTFAAVNGVVSCLAVVFGHRLVVKRLTCGLCGRRGSRSWMYLWVLPVGLQLAANASIALLIKKSIGYKSDFKISEMMLFLCARPRLSWIVLGAFAFKSQKRKSGENHGYNMRTPNPNQYQSPMVSQQSFAPDGSQTSFNKPHFTSRAYENVPFNDYDTPSSFMNDRDFPWWSAFMSQFIGEFILQIITLYIMGRTAHFATNNGYYKIYLKTYWDIPGPARMMYSGALYYLVAGSLFLISTFTFIMSSMRSSRVKEWGKASSGRIIFALLVLLISTWMGSWIFWAGFVKLAGDLYCPPKLIQQGVIWTFFSTIGIVLGTGV